MNQTQPENLQAAPPAGTLAGDMGTLMVEAGLPSTRKEAREVGSDLFFTGVKCLRGHFAPRRTSVGACIECQRERSRSWREANIDRDRALKRARYLANAEAISAKKRAEYRENPEYFRGRNREYHKARDPEKARDSRKSWRAANQEKLAEYIRAWQRANRDKVRVRNKKWSDANIEAVRAFRQNRRARECAAEGIHTAADVGRLLEAQGHRCAYCKTSVKKKRHLDHIVPLAKGGTNWPNNLQVLCPPCNQSKNAKDPIEFARELGRLL